MENYSDHIYCYPNSSILRNKLGILEADVLENAERKLTMLRLYELMEKPIQGNFDLSHLCAIHRHIFQDLYDWAGELRTVDIAKGNLFCKVEYLQLECDKLFSALKNDLDHPFSEEETVKKLAYYLAELNALHPFREGNGRTQREFIRQLSTYWGYSLSYVSITREEMLKASQESFLCDYTSMEKLLSRGMRKK